MRAAFVLVLLAAPAVAQDPVVPAAATAPVPVAGELKKFQGFWKPESVRYDGVEQMPEAGQRKLMTLLIKGAEYRMYVLADAAKDEHYRLLTAELTVKPDNRTFEITVNTSKTAPQKRHGIYEFRGDKLVMCYADAAKPLPAAFAADKGTEQFLEVWAKEKK